MCLSKTVKFFVRIVFVTLYIASFNVIACGPSPQKVVREITIKADAEVVWAIIGNFETMHLWHPQIKSTRISVQNDANGQATRYRTLTLASGEKMVERLRENGVGTSTQKMKLGTYMESGDIPVSNYSNVISVMPSLVENETKVVWIARFNNKANLMQAPAGQDDATAIAAITQFYDAGLSALKKRLDAQATSQSSWKTTQTISKI